MERKNKAVVREFKFFVEKCEFPLISARGCVARIGGPLTMQFQIVTAGDPHFLGRTHVELFMYDSLEYPNGMLIFEGEMLNYSYYAVGTGVTILNCVSSQSYQQQMFLNLLTQSEDPEEELKKKPTTLGERFSAFMGALTVEKYKELYKALFSRPITQNIDGLLGGLIHLMERFAGVQKGKVRLKPADNFIGTAEQRLSLLQRIAAPSNDRTINKLMKLGSTKKWIEKILKAARGDTSLNYAEFKGAILSRLHYRSIVSCMSKYLPERVEIREIPISSEGISGLRKEFEPVLNWLKELKKELLGANVSIAYDMRKHACFAVEYMTLPTDILTLTAAYFEGARTPEQASAEMSFLTSPKVIATRRVQKTIIDDYARNAANFLGLTYDRILELAKEGPLSALPRKTYETKLNALYDSVDKALTFLKKWLNAITGTLTGTQKRKVNLLPRFHEEILLPDLWFAMPPVCNVILAKMYETINISRAYSREPSRLLLVGPKIGFEGTYLSCRGHTLVVAPNLKGNVGKVILEDVLKGKYTLLPHEIFMGPQPLVVPITQALALAEFESKHGESSEDEYEGIGLGAPPDLQKLLDRSPLSRGFPFLQRVAHALFMDRYFDVRRASLSGPFFPRLIAGLPAVIQVQEPISGTYELYTGDIQQIDVIITGSHARATVQISHLRSVHDWEKWPVHLRMYKADPYASFDARWKSSKNKLLQAMQMDKPVGTGFPDMQPVLDALASMQQDTTAKLKKISASMQQDITAKSKKIKKKKSKEKEKLDNILHLTNAVHSYAQQMQKIRTEISKIRALDSDTMTFWAKKPETGAATTEELVATQDKALTNATAEYEQYARKFDEKLNRLLNLTNELSGIVSIKETKSSFDDLCRPPWLDSIYDNENIGRVYQEFWGVDSIYDALKSHWKEAVPHASERSIFEWATFFIELLDGPFDSRLFRKDIITPDELHSFLKTRKETSPNDPTGLRWLRVYAAHEKLLKTTPSHGAMTAR